MSMRGQCEVAVDAPWDRLAAWNPVVELVGAVLILSAFVLAQLRRLTTGSVAYLVFNLTGSATLAVVATIDRDARLPALGGEWAAVSALALARLLLRRSPA